MSNSYLHSGDLGDIIYALPIIRSIGKGPLYLAPGPGTRRQITTNDIRFMSALLEAQPYIALVKKHEGERIRHDFTGFRTMYRSHRTLVESQRSYIGGKPSTDPWLSVGNVERHGKTVIARSGRYRSKDWARIWPEIVKQRDCVFVGLPEEHEEFCESFGDLDLIEVKDAMAMAKLIAGCREFVGNQSLPMAIAIGLGVPYIQETCAERPDCIFTDRIAMHIRECEHDPAEQVESALAAIQRRLILALQVSHVDSAQAVNLARIMARFERIKSSDSFVLVVASHRVPEHDLAAIRDALRPAFGERLRCVTAKINATGWPLGPNEQWIATVGEAQAVAKQDRRLCGVLTFEPDCCPLHPGWDGAIRDEWLSACCAGKSFLGWSDGKHINGNLVTVPDILSRHPEMQRDRGGKAWDGAHKKLIMSEGMSSRTIFSHYKSRDVSPAFLEDLLQKQTALVHGIKDESGRRWAEARA